MTAKAGDVTAAGERGDIKRQHHTSVDTGVLPKGGGTRTNDYALVIRTPDAMEVTGNPVTTHCHGDVAEGGANDPATPCRRSADEDDTMAPLNDAAQAKRLI